MCLYEAVPVCVPMCLYEAVPVCVPMCLYKAVPVCLCLCALLYPSLCVPVAIVRPTDRRAARVGHVTCPLADFMIKGDMLVENMKYLGRITSNPILEVRHRYRCYWLYVCVCDE
jgi:hypothetical protein